MMNMQEAFNSETTYPDSRLFKRVTPSRNCRTLNNDEKYQMPEDNVSKKQPTAVVNVQWQDVSYTVSLGWRKGTKTLIKNHWGRANSGELTALIGPSGSGKTTLLKILAGYIYRNRGGIITLNGKLQTKEIQRMYTRYIMQHSEEHPYLTTREVISMAAKLKLPSNHDDTSAVVVSEVIQILGLNACQNTRTKNLSGGEKRRLALAQELVDNPPVLFLDEPTSGLDSTSCFQLVQLLKNLAERGHTIICSIHQPSARILNFFDKMYVISKGECVFQDSVTALLPFLESQGLQCPPYHNPVNYMLEVIAGLYGDYTECFKSIVKSKRGEIENSKLKDMQQSSTAQHSELSSKKCWNFPSSPWTQFFVILLRNYKDMVRNPILTHLRLAAHVVVAVVYGLLMYRIGNDASELTYNATFLFISVSFLTFTSLMMTVLTFPLEMSIFLKEHNNNWYSLFIYYLAKTTADLPVQAVFSTLYIVIIYWMTDQPNESYRFGFFLAIGMLTSVAAQSMGLLLGAALKFEAALFLGPTVLILSITFTEFFVRVEKLQPYLKWIPKVNYFRYSFEGTLLTIYGYNRTSLYCPEGELCLITDPSVYLETVGVERETVWPDIVAIVGFIFALRILGYITMKWKIYFQK